MINSPDGTSRSSGPDDFNWVEACLSCSVDRVFNKLKEDTEQDVYAFNRLDPENAKYRKFQIHDEKQFLVVGPGLVEMVAFVRKPSGIIIQEFDGQSETGRKTIMELTSRLDDDGNCVLVDKGGAVWKPWQVRLRALEGVLSG